MSFTPIPDTRCDDCGHRPHAAHVCPDRILTRYGHHSQDNPCTCATDDGGERARLDQQRAVELAEVLRVYRETEQQAERERRAVITARHIAERERRAAEYHATPDPRPPTLGAPAMPTPAPRSPLEENLVVRVSADVKPQAAARASLDGYPDVSAAVRALVDGYAAGNIALPPYTAPPEDPRRAQLFELVDGGASLHKAVQEVGCVYRTGRRWLEERDVQRARLEAAAVQA